MSVEKLKTLSSLGSIVSIATRVRPASPDATESFVQLQGQIDRLVTLIRDAFIEIGKSISILGTEAVTLLSLRGASTASGVLLSVRSSSAVQPAVTVANEAGNQYPLFRLGNNPTVTIHVYAGNPNGAVTANPGSICLNTNGGAGVSLYVKEAGIGTNLNWVGK